MPSAEKDNYADNSCGLCGALPCDQTGTCNDSLQVQIIGGTEGDSLYISGYRVAGPKPWGGGTVKQTFTVAGKDMAEALRDWRR